MKIFQLGNDVQDNLNVNFGVTPVTCRWLALQDVPVFSVSKESKDLLDRQALILHTSDKDSIIRLQLWLNKVAMIMAQGHAASREAKEIVVSDPTCSWKYKVKCWPSAVQHTYDTRGLYLLKLRLTVWTWDQA